MTIQADEATIDWLIKKGFDPQMGARPLARMIADSVKTPLARLMIMGDLKKGGIAHLSIADDQLVVTP